MYALIGKHLDNKCQLLLIFDAVMYRFILAQFDASVDIVYSKSEDILRARSLHVISSIAPSTCVKT